MFVFSGKKILGFTVFLSLVIILAIAFFSNINDNSVTTMAIPITNRTIILDAGHGLPDEGAESSNGITESSINLKIVMKVKKLLEDIHANVILTRSDENGIYSSNANTIHEKKVSDLKNRVEIANNSNADIFISIHLNKISESKYSGWQTFYKSDNEKGKILAQVIQKNLNNTIIETENKREPHNIENVYIMEHIKIPATIVECGFLSNPEDERLLQLDEYQDKLALGIFMGIVEYFNL